MKISYVSTDESSITLLQKTKIGQNQSDRKNSIFSICGMEKMQKIERTVKINNEKPAVAVEQAMK